MSHWSRVLFWMLVAASNGGVDSCCLGARVRHSDNQAGPVISSQFDHDGLQLAQGVDELHVSLFYEGACGDQAREVGAWHAQA